MHATYFSLRRGAFLIAAGAALALPALRAADAAPSPESDAFPTYDSYIKLTGASPWSTGDRAAAAARTDMPNLGAYGIEDLVYTKDLSKDVTMDVDGKALYGSENYLAHLKIEGTDYGSIDFGYKRFRTFYDGVGGFFPLADEFLRASPENLHVDRGNFWFEAKLAKPNRPVVVVSYHNEVRSGQKDSSEWGLAINPNAVVTGGALVGTAAPANTVAIAPNTLTLAEHHGTLNLSVTATAGKTTELIKATFDSVNNVDTRNYVRYPNSNVLADMATSILDDQEANKTNSFRILSQTETRFNTRLALEVGLTYLHASGSDGGNWVTPAYTATANAIFNTVTAGNIVADPKVDDYVGNVFLKFTPTPNWRADVGFREESSVISDHGGFITTSLATGATSTAASNVTTAQDVTYSNYTDHVASPEVSLQYLGFSHLSLYTNFDDRVTGGNQHWINPYAAVTTTGAGVVTTVAPAPIADVFFQSANQDYENLKVGANWNASSRVTVRAELFHQDHVNKFIGDNDYVGTASYGGLYATSYMFNGVTLSLTCKPVPELSFVTRYQNQSGDMAVTSDAVTGGETSESPSGKARAQIVSETIDWSPYRQLYAEGSVNVVYNYIDTSYPTVVVTTTPPLVPVPFQNANNNYVTATGLCGFALDKTTDAQIQGTWQRADNYNPQIALGGQPYGATFEYESVTAGLKHKFSQRVIGEGKVGYLRDTDGTSGGFTNYHGPLAYIALEFAL